MKISKPSSIIFKIAVFFFFLSITSPAYGATITAASCERADVQAAINSAVSGDTVAVPAGNCSWSSVVTISGKDISFHGAGVDVTNVALATQYALTISSISNHHLDVSGFTFIGSGTVDNGFISVGGDDTGSVRIHNNKFRDGSGYHLNISNRSRTVVDHNYFSGAYQNIFVNQHNGTQWNNTQIDSLKKPIGWGEGWSNEVEWVFVEDNIFRQPCANQNASIMDIQMSGKMVFRRNTVYNGYIVTHGSCWSSRANTGVYAGDFYDNTFIMENGCSHYALTDWMGGTLLFHGNILKYYGTGHFDADFCPSSSATCPHNWQDVRTRDTYHNCNNVNNMWMYCDGSQNMWCSGSTDSQWYTCNTANDHCAEADKGTCSKKHCSNSWELCTTDSDCPGGTCSGYLDNLDESSGRVCFNSTGAGRLNEATGKNDSEPLYFWDNSLHICDASGNNCLYSKRIDIDDSDISANTKLNIDFFNNTLKPGYVSYVYPHPLVSDEVIDITPPTTPSGLVVN